MTRTLSEYISEFGTIGQVAFEKRYPSPMLLRLDFEKLEDDERSYQTAFLPAIEMQVKPSGNIAFPSSEVADLDVTLQDVFPVAKRADGAFQDRIGVGRTPNVDVCLPLPRVSKYHAFFTCSDDGAQHFLTDAGSKNGTRIAGRRLMAKAATELHNGDEIQLGPYRFVFFTPAGFHKLIQERASDG